MQKVITAILLLTLSLVSIIGGAIGCAEEEEITPTELLPVNVSVLPAETLFSGKEATHLRFSFSVENPNTIPITLEGITFNVYGDDNLLGMVAIQEAYWIPAGKEIRVNELLTVAFFHLYVNFMLVGKAQEAPAFYGQIGEGAITYQIEGRAEITSEIGPLTSKFSGQTSAR